jgi:hypothetical protein
VESTERLTGLVVAPDGAIHVLGGWHSDDGALVVRIDPETGVETPLNPLERIDGGAYLAMENSSTLLVVSDEPVVIHRVDMTSGAVTPVHTVTAFSGIRDVKMEPGGDLIILDEEGLLLRVELFSGDEILINGSAPVSGGESVVVADDERLIVTTRTGEIYVVDSMTGETVAFNDVGDLSTMITHSVPEPETWLLQVTALFALAMMRRRGRRRDLAGRSC